MTSSRIADFSAWDVAYATERRKARHFAFSEQEVKQYLPEDRVLAGLFRVVETIYGVTISQGNAATWHPSVRFFEMRDKAGALVGQFYLDLYAREGKQSGAWMDDAINRRHTHDRLQHPVAYLTCNFSGPQDGHAAHFTHREVITLFHEFGHGLHQLLTRIDVAGVSGLQGVEWDAVELPSQFMENYCWEWDVLAHMAAHARNGRAAAARAVRSNARVPELRQRHGDGPPDRVRAVRHAVAQRVRSGWRRTHASPQAVLDAVRREVAVVPRPPYDRFMHAFGHIFAGGYAAGYYSYKWAEVMSADAYSLFEERGVMSPEIGARFRDEVLARGGSRPAFESFVAFRGRPPQLDALLRHNGMVAT